MQKKIATIKKRRKKTLHLDCYNRAVANNFKLTRKNNYLSDGLCNLAFWGEIDRKLFKKWIEPTDDVMLKLGEEGKSILYWASDDRHGRLYELTPLRENIILLMAAIKGEL